ncbi:toxin co-regulated pilus biosynthesis Q family protein [Xanthomonas arboricola]|uniref:Type IV pili sensor histidine kinase/response regulator n=1 Tax=Xanthomonas arboricola TaxID=56448 RepID=A0AB73H2N8_9XANT|nr:toxin co-regulated pilus biosynthesis Q family protein [Xanthomonas arboricola]MBB5672615.1 type IV pili sensor histidine kinase/response regulator [Xanthomonas arboricola]
MTQNQIRIAVIALIAAAPFSAIAGFRVINPPKPEAHESAKERIEDGFSPGRPAVKQYGQPGRIELRQGFGRELPLSLVIKQIVPTDWETVFAKSVQGTKPVSWRGGKTWTEVLSDVALQEGVYADVDWDKRKVTLLQNQSPVVAASPKTGSTKGASSDVGSVHAEAPSKKTWVAENGTSLRYSVTEWSKRAGWTVVWDAEVDYPIAGTLTYEGDFVDAVAGIFRAHSRSAIPLRVDIYPRQKLIHIPKE